MAAGSEKWTGGSDGRLKSKEKADKEDNMLIKSGLQQDSVVMGYKDKRSINDQQRAGGETDARKKKGKQQRQSEKLKVTMSGSNRKKIC